MKKIILIIIAGVIVAGGIGGYLYFNKKLTPKEPELEHRVSPPQGGTIQGKCGDGICQDIERERGVCEDCKVPQTQETEETTTEQQPTTTANDQSQQSFNEINFHQLASGKNFGDILKLFNPVIDEENKRLYVVGSKTTNVGVIDLNTEGLIDVFDMGVPGGFLIFKNNNLYSFDFGASKCYQIDTKQKKATEISVDTCESIVPNNKDNSKKWGNYSFKETGYQSFKDGTTGFLTDWSQDLNGAYGIIEISDSSGKKVGKIIHGPDALYFDIDDTTGKLYTTNTGDGSISIFDLNKLKSTNYCENNSCLIKEIDVGNSADEVMMDSSGNMYVRNRLGGSVVYKYNTKSKEFTIINNENHESGGLGMWPTDMELSKDEKRLYVLSHYGALIDVVDTATSKVINKIKFTTALKPRTDSISAMAVDKSRDRIYAAWPELGIIGVVDVLNGKIVRTIDLASYGFDKSKAANAGPGFVNLAVNIEKNKLYVHLYNEKKLMVFNGSTLSMEKETSIELTKKSELSLFSNDKKELLYLGEKILSNSDFSEADGFSAGQKAVAVSNDGSEVYVVEMLLTSPGKAKEKISKIVNGAASEEWILDDIGSVPSRFYFDFNSNVFYVAYFESGVVKKYDLNAGSAPTTRSSGGAPATGSPQNSGSAKQGKCGDGICGAVEKEKGVCPADCK